MDYLMAFLTDRVVMPLVHLCHAGIPAVMAYAMASLIFDQEVGTWVFVAVLVLELLRARYRAFDPGTIIQLRFKDKNNDSDDGDSVLISIQDKP